MAEDQEKGKGIKGFFGFGRPAGNASAGNANRIEEDPFPEKPASAKQISPDAPVGFEEDVPDTPSDDHQESEDDGRQQKPSQSDDSSDPLMMLAMLRQRIEMLEKGKSELNRSFSDMNRIVGELRSRILEQEKYIDILESKSNVANDMLKLIDPVQLGKDFEEQKAKIDAIDAKIESFISLSDSVKSEISAVDSKIASIGTPDEIKSMNKDMQNLLKDVISRESRLSARLERSENLFYDMQKNYTESLRFFSTIDAISSSLRNIQSEYMKMDIALKNYVSSDIFSKRISEIEHFLKHMEDKYSSILNGSGIRESSLGNESIVVSNAVKNIRAADEIESIVKSVERGPGRIPSRVRPGSVNPSQQTALTAQIAQTAQTAQTVQNTKSNQSDQVSQAGTGKPGKDGPGKENIIRERNGNKDDFDDMIFSRSY